MIPFLQQKHTAATKSAHLDIAHVFMTLTILSKLGGVCVLLNGETD